MFGKHPTQQLMPGKRQAKPCWDFTGNQNKETCFESDDILSQVINWLKWVDQEKWNATLHGTFAFPFIPTSCMDREKIIIIIINNK